ncbi:MAG: hypothetical protein KGO81_14970 [Bacteroidota bacterium]|nr:hypothetical protein [Bacteroidota bacterium]
MKNRFFLYIGGMMLLLASCSHKTIPAAHHTAPAAVSMIVIDGYGRVLTPADKLYSSTHLQPNYAAITRAFTPNQMKNLQYRYNMIPPKVIYVSDVYTQHSLKGTYCVYKQKFWYWKKADGLFYLDERYYR